MFKTSVEEFYNKCKRGLQQLLKMFIASVEDVYNINKCQRCL